MCVRPYPWSLDWVLDLSHDVRALTERTTQNGDEVE